MKRKLGPRGKEVVDLLCRGYTNKQIARALDIAERTVKMHLNRAFVMYDIDPSVYVPRVALATILLYQKNPELVPFFDGDRASQYGLPSACDHLRTLDEAEAYREGGSAPRETARLSDREYK
jgi:hypothetical protein